LILSDLRTLATKFMNNPGWTEEVKDEREAEAQEKG
jgi:hypothetical protein